VWVETGDVGSREGAAEQSGVPWANEVALEGLEDITKVLSYAGRIGGLWGLGSTEGDAKGYIGSGFKAAPVEVP
jgi:hypothetical protein